MQICAVSRLPCISALHAGLSNSSEDPYKLRGSLCLLGVQELMVISLANLLLQTS